MSQDRHPIGSDLNIDTIEIIAICATSKSVAFCTKKVGSIQVQETTNSSAVTERRSVQRTQEKRREEAMKALLDAAEELIGRHGIASASVARIGAHAGYSRGLVTHHFGTKDKLLEALVDRQRRTLLNSMGAINGDDGLDWLTKLLDAYVDAFAERPMYVRSWLVLRSTAHPETGSTFDIEGYDKGSRKIVASWIRRGQRDGSIRPDVSPETAAWHVLALGRGLGEQLLVAKDTVDITELKSQTRKLLSFALAAPVEQDARRT